MQRGSFSRVFDGWALDLQAAARGVQDGCKMDVSGTESDQLPSIHKFVSSLSYAVFSS